MTWAAGHVRRAIDLLDLGLSQAEVARRIGVPRGTVRCWITSGTERTLTRRSESEHNCADGAECRRVAAAPEEPYAYLLGLYLGDGYISEFRPGLFRLRISLDQKYPAIVNECDAAMAQVLPNKVGRANCPGCISVNSYSKHWVCLFPQHAAGVKHLRRIILKPWQERIALDQHPRLLLRGLVHSDGYRGLNRIRGRYAYPRYMFSNRSADIRDLFAAACQRVGIVPTRCGQWQLSVARRKDVATMDEFIGPKT